MSNFNGKLGIDLGTANVIIYSDGQILLKEPPIAALRVEDNQIIAIGQEVRDMLGIPANIKVVRPLRDGVIADYEVTEAMLRHFFQKVTDKLQGCDSLTVMISVPYGATSVERRAVHEAAIQAGARDAILIHEPLAAAIGAGLSVKTPASRMILNLSSETSEATILAMNGIVTTSSIRIGGTHLDEALVKYVRHKYNLFIGQRSAQQIKILIGAATNQPDELTAELRGRDQVGGLPRAITISINEVVEAIADPLNSIANVAKDVLEKTPELVSNIIDRGITLTGGGALLRGIDDYIRQQTGVSAFRADDPVVCTAAGAYIYLASIR
jgi:rod shape-determining protein MreB